MAFPDGCTSFRAMTPAFNGSRLFLPLPGNGQSMLADRTEMRPPATDHDPPDGRRTHQAGLASTQVDAMLQLEEPTHPIGVHIIGYRGTAPLDRLAQHQL